MNKRRALICALVFLIAVLAFTLTACDKEPVEPTPPIDPDVPTELPGADTPSGYILSFEDTAGVSFESDKTPGERIGAGQTVTFTVKVSVFYEGTPSVYAGDTRLEPDSDGRYSVTVNENVKISVSGLALKSSSMDGDGDSIDDPFLITEAIDLIYIAQQVNLGNSAYIYGFYSLQNDIDCLGEKLDVIGNGELDQAVFAGYFNGNGHTISNYRIETDSSKYVGLFGILQADTVSSQGGTVNNLKLKDFTMTVSATGVSCFCGSLVGYGMGGNLMLCSAENGRIELHADYNSFAYVGGLIGIQQALDYNSLAYYSSVSYCTSDVDVSCNSGSVYAAGGITGYLSASSQLVTASVNNSYSTGSVHGALHTGGVVGHLAAGTSVINCYSIGAVSAQSFAKDPINSLAFCYAYAGGVAGYSEPDCVISESFSASSISVKASLGSDYEMRGGVLAGFEEPGEYELASNAVTVFNCSYAEGGADGDIVLTGSGYLKDVLNWKDEDWSFSQGGYPTINTADAGDFTFTVSFRFGETDGSDGGSDVEISGFDVYMPLSYWYSAGEMGGIPSRLTGEEGDGRISWGYFFDAGYTLPVPESFIPTRDITLYAAVADVSQIAGEYILDVDGDGGRLTLTLGADGRTLTYSDAGGSSTSYYIYDGKMIILGDVRLARYAAGGADMDKYSLYDFFATPDNGRLVIIGGVYENDDGDETAYFTASSPLIAVSADISLDGRYTDGESIYEFRADGTGIKRTGTLTEDIAYTLTGGALKVKSASGELDGAVQDGKITLGGKALSATDAFYGGWSISFGASRTYTFDGFGGWSYSYYGYRYSGGTYSRVYYERLSGSYTVTDGVAHLSGGLEGSAVLEDGCLHVSIGGDKAVYYRDGSFCGTWIYEDYGLTLKLEGIGASGVGTAHIEYEYSNGIIEKYALTYALDELDGGTVCLYYGSEAFGYMSYLPSRGTLNATIYVGPLGSFMQNVDLRRVDEYAGAWIGESAELPLLSFDGLGGYLGVLTVNGEVVPYTLDERTLEGSFAYGGRVYLISYDEVSGRITVSGEEYRRADAFGELVLTDKDGGIYTFDGRGELALGGKLIVSGASGSSAGYMYRLDGETVRIYRDGTEVGTIVKDTDRNEYVLTLDGGEGVGLRIKTRFTGVWAMNGSITNMVIGSMGLDGKLDGTVKGGDAVTFERLDDMTLRFKYSGTTFYAIFVGESNIVISSYEDWYLYGDQQLCAPADELSGTWRYTIGVGIVSAWQFDGMSGSTLTSGTAQTGMMSNGEISSPTSYYYNCTDGRYVLWTVGSDGLTRIYRIEFCDPSEKRAFVSEDGTRAFKVVEGDRLYKMDALDDRSGVTYSFDGFRCAVSSEGDTYDYSLLSEIDYVNGTVRVKLERDGVSLVAVIDFSGSQCYITFVDVA